MRRFILGLPVVVLFLLAAPASAVNGVWVGTLAAAPADAKEGVVAVLNVKEGEKDLVYNLKAEGDVAKQLKEMAATGLKASITGSKIDDTTLKVSKVEKAE